MYGQPLTLTGTAPAERDVFSCATSAILAAGYTVETMDRPTGFIRANRPDVDATAVLFNVQKWDLVTVIVIDEPTGRQSLQVVASRREVGHPNVFQTSDVIGKPTDEGLALATSIVERCTV